MPTPQGSVDGTCNQRFIARLNAVFELERPPPSIEIGVKRPLPKPYFEFFELLRVQLPSTAKDNEILEIRTRAIHGHLAGELADRLDWLAPCVVPPSLAEAGFGSC